MGYCYDLARVRQAASPSERGNRVLESMRAVVGVRSSALDRRSGESGPGFDSGSGSGFASWWVAFSGGVDSTVLLEAAARILGEQAAERLAAVHVNHGLHPNAGAWEEHCRAAAARLGIRLEVRRVSVPADAGRGGLEAAARAARHAALCGAIPPGAPVLLAHHRDDQAETVLHRILRGAGPAGMAAMRPDVTLGDLRVVRPLLAVSRAEILAYAKEQGLSWVEDPGNLDLAYDRSHVRNRILPALADRWPGAPATLARLAERSCETASMLDDLAAVDLETARGRTPDTVRARVIAALPPPRAANALRVWLVARHRIAPPSRRWLRTLVEEVAAARPDRLPEAVRGGIWVRRYRDELHTGQERAAPRLPASILWSLDGGSFELPHGRLTAVRTEGEGLAAGRVPLAVEVRFRRGGERCCPAPRGVTKPLKDLFQELGIPPWERGVRPLVFAEGRLASAPGLFVCEPFAARGTEPAWRVEWTPCRG